jgi:hypothetical protein
MKLTIAGYTRGMCKDGFERECVHAAGYPNGF